jgi:hypothetical protein
MGSVRALMKGLFRFVVCLGVATAGWLIFRTESLPKDLRHMGLVAVVGGLVFLVVRRQE